MGAGGMIGGPAIEAAMADVAARARIARRTEEDLLEEANAARDTGIFVDGFDDSSLRGFTAANGPERSRDAAVQASTVPNNITTIASARPRRFSGKVTKPKPQKKLLSNFPRPGEEGYKPPPPPPPPPAGDAAGSIAS